MKYFVAFVSFLAVFSTASAFRRLLFGNGNCDNLAGFQAQIFRDPLLIPLLVAALTDAGFPQLVVNSEGNETVDFDRFFQNSFLVFPAIAPFINQNIIPRLSPIDQARLNETLRVIQDLPNNRVLLNSLIAELSRRRLNAFIQVQNRTPSVDFTRLVNDVNGAAVLNNFIAREVEQRIRQQILSQKFQNRNGFFSGLLSRLF